MRLAVRLDPSALRRWHLELVTALAGRTDLDVAVRWSTPPRPVAREVEGLFTLERLLHRLPPGRSARLAGERLAAYLAPDGTADVVLDLVGDDGAASPTWHLTFDGHAGEDALLGALLAGRPPAVRVVDLAAGRTLAAGRPGSESPGVTVAAFEDVLAGCTRLIHAALDGGAPGAVADGPPSPLRREAVLRHAGRSAVRAAVHRLYRLLYRAPHWRVGWRWVDGPDVVDLGRLPGGWAELPDDGRHFYADPFPAVVDGATYLFVEDFDHRLGRGVISVVPVGSTGPVGTPWPVLEHGVHLSYPFVLEDAGQQWMIPETSGAGTVELYRAASFPSVWTLEEVLLDGLEVSDATPFRHGGRWWLSATVREGGSFSDALYLWSADRLQGPWVPHVRNPVLVDIAAARPAGRVVHRGGRLVRPVQDGSGGYGAALALAEVTRLDDTGFAQRVVSRITPGPQWPGTRLHTLNRAGRLEVVDGSAYSPRFRYLAWPGRR
ncbi:glucosamine inositolphosphorylceramide transferase family protein [Georgenia satyanarayanai]|uniref:glucosamine inositolphosphorylceramide transferase family protein n=1 Tax=Georgenia satyanarayanai TaxID=860221 RepID=UPI00186AECAC|nr:formyl transferase [Georgenia satyanarayanai]